MSPDDIAVAAGALISLVIAPAALVWPRAWAHAVTPPRLRWWVGRRPWVGAAAVAAPVLLLSGASMSHWMLGGVVHRSPAMDGATAAAVVWLVFGGLTAVAFARALIVGAGEWRLTDGRSTTPRRWHQCLPAVELPDVVPDTRAAWDFERPVAEQLDRGLRGFGHWLAAGGLLWCLIGRLTQLGHLAGGDGVGGVDPPGWWWPVAAVLLATGAAVWVTQRSRSHRARSGSGDDAGNRTERDPALDARPSLPELLGTWGFAVVEPAGEWLRSETPGVFLPVGAVTGPSCWPWAAHGTLDGHPVVVAQHRAQVRGRTGLTFGRTRCAGTIRVPGGRLPLVVVGDREAVPPSQRDRSIDLELPGVDRSLCAWGPDPRGFGTVLHPLAVSMISRDLPDGASLRFAGDQIAVFSDEPVSGAQLAAALRLVSRLAEHAPAYVSR